MRALVTGATGFIGGHLCQGLRARGWDVHALTRPESDRARVPAGVTCWTSAVTAVELTRTLERARPDVIFHLASRFVAEHRPEDVEGLVAANVGATASLLEASAASGVTRWVAAGSTWQHHGEGGREAVNLYAVTKNAQVALIDWYAVARGLRAVTLEIFDSYGPDDRRRKLVQTLIELGPGAHLDLSPGEQRLVLVHVADLVSAFEIAAERVLATEVGGHERFVLDGDERVSIRELVARIERARGTALDVRFGARPYRAREVMEPWSDGVRLPGWRPTRSLDAGLAELVALGRPQAETAR